MSRLLGRLLKDLRPHRRFVLGVVVCTFVYAAARIVPPLVARLLLNRTLRGHAVHLGGLTLPPDQAVVVVPALLLALAGLLAASQYLMRLWGGLLGQHVVGDFQVRLLEHLLRMPSASLERRPLGRHMVRFGSDMTAVRRFVSRSLPEFVRDGTAVVAIGAALVSVHRPLALPIAAALAIDLVVVMLTWRHLQYASRSVRSERSRIAGMAFDRLSAAAAVKLAGRERREAAHLQRAQTRLLGATRRTAELSGLLSGGAEIVVGIAIAVSLGLGAQRALTGTMSSGEMVAFYGLALLLVSPLRSLARTVESLAPGTVAVQKLYRTLDQAPESDHARAAPLEVGRGEVAFTHVRIAETRLPDLTVGPGVTVVTGGVGIAALGPLLLRLREPDEGSITIDGTEIAQVMLRSLRRAVAYVPFPPSLVKGSLRRTLRSGLHDVSDERIRGALRAAGVSWADDLELRVGGGRLTPFQRWQVLVARTLLAAPAIAVMELPPVEDRDLGPVLQVMRGAGIRTIILLGSQVQTPGIDRIISLDDLTVRHHA